MVTLAEAKKWRPSYPLPKLGSKQLLLLALVGELQPVSRPTLVARLGLHPGNISHHISILRYLRLVESLPQRGPNARIYLWGHAPKVKPTMPPVVRTPARAQAADDIEQPTAPATSAAWVRPANSAWDFARVVHSQPAKHGRGPSR